MTLSPVFRSEEAVRLLMDGGLVDLLAPALERQLAAVDAVRADLREVLGPRFLAPQAPAPRQRSEAERLAFVQEFFFLTLFGAVFEQLGVAPARLQTYAELDFCVMGTITAADNLFDDQSKLLLPLSAGAGPRFASILQLICFERLARRVGDRAVARGVVAAGDFERVQRGLLDQMAAIGSLEGSEEAGVDAVPPPEQMLGEVHRVRGGQLFGLAAVAPRTLEEGPIIARIEAAERALVDLGTAFQVVDDLTDFEFDLGRRSHNLLVSWVHHGGTAAERSELAALRAGRRPVEPRVVEVLFGESAAKVLDLARRLGRQAFEGLADLGFAFPPELADAVVHAIVGLDGVARMQTLTGEQRPVDGPDEGDPAGAP